MGANINGFLDWRGIADGEGLVWNAARNSFLPGAVGGGIATVENGLTLSAGVLKLGGPLTENTSIGGAGFNLEIASLGNFTLSGSGLGTISANQLALSGGSKGENWTGSYLGSFGGTFGLTASGGLSLTETNSNGQLTLTASGGLGIVALLSNGEIQQEAVNSISIQSTNGSVSIQSATTLNLISGQKMTFTPTFATNSANDEAFKINAYCQANNGASGTPSIGEFSGTLFNNTGSGFATGIGYSYFVQFNGNDEFTNIRAAQFSGVIGSGITTNTSNAYTNYVRQITNTSSGNLVNSHGIYVESINGGTSSNYAIYTNAGVCRFGDDVDIVGDLSAGNALSITGSRGGNAALASLLTQLATTGIIVDNTTA